MSAKVQPLFDTPPRERETPRRQAMEALLRRVEAEAQDAPHNYVRDAKVPAGGE
jgi:hypothetical protein